MPPLSWTSWVRVAVLVWVCFIATGVVADEADPLMVVESTTQQVLQALASRRTELEQDPALLRQLIDDIVVPKFDFLRIARSVLGSFWHQASPAQQTAFRQAFQDLLIQTYGVALLNYSGRPIDYLPVRLGNERSRAMVSARIQEPGSPPLTLSYRLRRTAECWRVIDVAIDGVSLVANYRNSFRSQIRRDGLDQLIQALQQRTQTVVPHERSD